MLLHDIATVRAKSPPGNIERSKMLDDLTFGQPRRAIRAVNRLRIILRVITVLEPLGGFGERRLFAILGYVLFTPLAIRSPSS
jgi:hypothetical protein